MPLVTTAVRSGEGDGSGTGDLLDISILLRDRLSGVSLNKFLQN
jgi:hypothetical protein